MLCPKCKKELIIVERNNIQVDYCIFCGGIWFDKSELEFLSSALREIDFQAPEICFLKSSKTNEDAINCPRCGQKMDNVMMNNKPPVIDKCPNDHGFWFDKKELEEYAQNNKIKSDGSLVSFLGEILNR